MVPVRPRPARLRAARGPALIELLFRASITGVVIAGVTLLARRDAILAGWISVFPTATSLALVWLALDKTPTPKILEFTGGVIAGLAPSVSILIAFAVLLRLNVPFGVSAVAVVGLWVLLTLVVRQFGLFQT